MCRASTTEPGYHKPELIDEKRAPFFSFQAASASLEADRSKPTHFEPLKADQIENGEVTR